MELLGTVVSSKIFFKSNCLKSSCNCIYSKRVNLCISISMHAHVTDYICVCTYIPTLSISQNVFHFVISAESYGQTYRPVLRLVMLVALWQLQMNFFKLSVQISSIWVNSDQRNSQEGQFQWQWGRTE